MKRNIFKKNAGFLMLSFCAGIFVIVNCPVVGFTEGSLIPLATEVYNTADFAEANDVVVDSKGNVIVTGTQEVIYSDHTDYRILTLKYNSNLELINSVIYDSVREDSGSAVGVDSSDNIIVAGKYWSDTGGTDICLIKYDSLLNESESSTVVYDGGDLDFIRDIIIDDSDNIFVLGISRISGTGRGDYDLLLLKYDKYLNFVESTTYNTTTDGYNNNDYASGIDIDSYGYIVIAGYNGFDYYVLKYSRYLDFQYSIAEPRKETPSSLEFIPTAISVDDSDEIVVAGTSSDHPVCDIKIVKFNRFLDRILGEKIYDNNKDYVNDIAILDFDDIIVAGMSNISVGYDALTLNYRVWSGMYGEEFSLRSNGTYDGGYGDDGLHAVVIDKDGNIICAGRTFDGDNFDILIIKYNGNPPEISYFTPTYALQGQRPQVNIVGSNFFEGAEVDFGDDGITVHSVDYISQNNIIADITIFTTSYVGIHNVTVKNVDDYSDAGDTYLNVVEFNVSSVMPSAAVQGENLSVVLTMENYTCSLIAKEVSFGEGIDVVNLSKTDFGELTADIHISTSASPGARDITFTMVGSEATFTKGTAFTINEDLELPKFLGVNAVTKQVNAGEFLTVAVDASDNGTGVEFVRVYIASPSGKQFTSFIINDIVDGLYQGSINISEYAEPGIWKIPFVDLSDWNKNFIICFVDENEDTIFEVISDTPDFEPPKLHEVVVETPFVKIGEEVKIKIRATDELSGIEKVHASIYHKDYSITSTSLTISWTSENTFIGSGVVETYGLPETDLLGEWDVRIVRLKDTALNEYVYENGKDYEATFHVLAEYLDPVLESISVTQGMQGEAITVNIQGSNFDEHSKVSFGEGITTTVNFINSEQLQVNIKIDKDALPGARNVTVTNPGDKSCTLFDAFKVRESELTTHTVDPAHDTILTFPNKIGEILLQIPANTFSETIVVNVSKIDPPASLFNSFKVTPVCLSIANDKDLQPKDDMTVTIHYSDKVIAEFNEEKLVMCRYDEQNQKWIMLPSEVFPETNTITAKVNHLSIFAVLEFAPAANLNAVKAYPNPYNPKRHVQGMKFDYLTQGAKIKIYTISGELVRELADIDADGCAVWDGNNDAGNKVASGVYLALIDGYSGNKTIKIAIER